MILAIFVNECVFCGKSGVNLYGSGCPFSPSGKHVKLGDSSKCTICGRSLYGKSCTMNKNGGVHIHGHGDHKCIYCGSTSMGKGCLFSPTGVHER